MAGVLSIQHYVIKFISDLCRYKWNTVTVEIMKGKIKNTTLSEQLQNLIEKSWKEEMWIIIFIRTSLCNTSDWLRSTNNIAFASEQAYVIPHNYCQRPWSDKNAYTRSTALDALFFNM
jgi:hypothetical protein